MPPLTSASLEAVPHQSFNFSLLLKIKSPVLKEIFIAYMFCEMNDIKNDSSEISKPSSLENAPVIFGDRLLKASQLL